MGGRGGSGGGASRNLFSENNGVRTYFDTEAGNKAFVRLSKNYVRWNKGAFISTGDGDRGVQVKRAEMFDAMSKRGINEFMLYVPKGQEKRALNALSDYGYGVVAQSEHNASVTAAFQEVRYYVSKKEMTYLGHDLKVKKYYKRGWKG